MSSKHRGKGLCALDKPAGLRGAGAFIFLYGWTFGGRLEKVHFVNEITKAVYIRVIVPDSGAHTPRVWSTWFDRVIVDKTGVLI